MYYCTPKFDTGLSISINNKIGPKYLKRNVLELHEVEKILSNTISLQTDRREQSSCVKFIHTNLGMDYTKMLLFGQ